MKNFFIKLYSTAMTLLMVFVVGLTSANAFAASNEEEAIAFQQVTITGTVVDENGDPMPGVNIIVKGTTTGTFTDANGKYTLSVPNADAVLEFTFIGYAAQEVKLGGRSVVDVSMKPESTALEEIVVIGYGTARKKDLTGSVVSADLSTLENSPNVNIAQKLKGSVPGLNIGAVRTAGEDPNISIRGQNSISGSTSPLIVLDGIIYRGSINDINPNDIQSIDVLKDASSTAVYGSQASNGVLLITSKTGRQLSKPTLEYNTTFSFQTLMNDKMKCLDSEGFIQQLYDIDYDHNRTGDDLLQIVPDYDVTYLFRDPSLYQAYSNKVNFDWYDALTVDVPYIQNHDLSLRGKNELSSYFFSVGLTDQKNIVKNDTYKRYNFRINLEANVTKWLKIGTQSFFTISDYSGVSPSFADVMALPSLVSPYDEKGELIPVVYMGSWVNPLLAVKSPDKDVRNMLSGNFYVDMNIPYVKGLNYRLNYSNALTAYKHYSYDPYAYSLLGEAKKDYSNNNTWTLDNILTYKRTFGKHAVNATIVYGVEKSTGEATQSRSRKFTNGLLGYNYMQAAQANLNTIGSQAGEWTSLYSMLRATYTYNDRYIFTGTVRRDGFSGFGKNYKIGLFPSAGIAWRINEENFIKDNISWINDWKIRASYGMNGNRTSPYATLAKMINGWRGFDRWFGSHGDGGYLYGDGAAPESTSTVASMSNADLRWEATASFNIGTDFSILNDRIFGSYEFYHSNTKNLLYNIAIPNLCGVKADGGNLTIVSNIGKLQNTGHEFSLTGLPVKNKNFTWSITSNFASNRNEVVSILGIDADKDGKEDDLIADNIFIGEPLNTVYDFNIIGMWQVADRKAGTIPPGFTYGTYKLEDLNNDGSFTRENDRKILGYRDPLYRFSIINDFTYKDFELKIFINSIQGGKNHYLGQPLSDLWNRDGLTYRSFYHFDYWTPENPNAKYRQLGNYYETAGFGFSPYVARSFIRLQEISLSYSLPSSLLHKISINRCRIFISATNLFTITDWDGWDPETGLGVQWFNGSPPMKNYTVGLNIEF